MQLTLAEKSIVTEILRVIGRDEYLNEQFAEANGMEVDDFNDIADDLFRKLVFDNHIRKRNELKRYARKFRPPNSVNARPSK